MYKDNMVFLGKGGRDHSVCCSMKLLCVWMKEKQSSEVFYTWEGSRIGLCCALTTIFGVVRKIKQNKNPHQPRCCGRGGVKLSSKYLTYRERRKRFGRREALGRSDRCQGDGCRRLDWDAEACCGEEDECDEVDEEHLLHGGRDGGGEAQRAS